MKRLTVNLAPASLRKEGPAYDLPIALGVLAAAGQILPETLEGTLIMGELSLDGTVRHVRGVLPMTALARAEGYQRVFVPAADGREAALIPGVQVIPVTSLTDLVNHLSGAAAITPVTVDRQTGQGDSFSGTDFAEVMWTILTHGPSRSGILCTQRARRFLPPECLAPPAI